MVNKVFESVPVDAERLLGADGAGRSERRHFDTLKRGIDIALGSILLVVAGPVMAMLALVILVFEGRPVLFRQTRVGRDGRLFTMFKFRTMVPDAEHQLVDLRDRNERHGPLFKLTVDPRVTRVGRVLRESSLDELPQLLNVLMGTMSLVGPRPALPDEIEQFDPDFLVRHRVRPGITGLWQVYCRDESSFESYQRLDLHYIHHRSLWMDLVILTRTVPTVVVRCCNRLGSSRSVRLPASPTPDSQASDGASLVPLRVRGF